MLKFAPMLDEKQSEQEIRELFRNHALLSAPDDLTARIIDRISHAPMYSPLSYKPLFNRKTWVFLISSVLILSGVAVTFAIRSESAAPSIAPDLAPFFSWAKSIHLEMPDAGPLLQRVTLVMVAIALLLLADFLFLRRSRSVPRPSQT